MIYFDAFTRFGFRPAKHASYPYTLEHLIEELRYCSISGALVLHEAQLRYDAMFENRRLTELLADHDNLFPLWNVYPHWTQEMPEPDKLLGELERHDVRAVTIFPNTNGWNALSRTSEPLLKALEAARILVIVDASEELLPPQVEELAQRYPDLPVLLHKTHWLRQRLIVPLILRYRNLHTTFDHLQMNRGVEWLTEQGCEDQLVFASNATYMAAGAHRFYVDYAEVSEAVRAKIAGGNLTRLLKGQAPRREVQNAQEDAIMTEARQGKPLSTLVLDFHAHMLDEGLNGAGGSCTMLDGGPRGTHRLAQRMGVDGIGIMSWNGLMVPDTRDGNRCVIDAMNAVPGFYWGLATFDVIHDSPDVLRQKMEELFQDPRFLGLKPYTTFGYRYDHEKYRPWWEFGNELGLYAALHPNHWDLSEFDSLCPRYPNLTFVAYHCGHSYEVADTVIDRARKYPNFMAEITLTPTCMGIIDYLVEGAGADRVLYGSDLPMRDPRQQLGWVVYSRLPLDQKTMVLGGNAQALLEKVRTNREAAMSGRQPAGVARPITDCL